MDAPKLIYAASSLLVMSHSFTQIESRWPGPSSSRNSFCFTNSLMKLYSDVIVVDLIWNPK